MLSVANRFMSMLSGPITAFEQYDKDKRITSPTVCSRLHVYVIFSDNYTLSRAHVDFRTTSATSRVCCCRAWILMGAQLAAVAVINLPSRCLMNTCHTR